MANLDQALSGLSKPAKASGKKVKVVDLGRAGSFKNPTTRHGAASAKGLKAMNHGGK